MASLDWGYRLLIVSHQERGSTAIDEGMEGLWRELRAELWRFVRVRVRDDARADDVIQAAFLRAHRHLEAGERPVKPRAWLFQVARNLVLDAARSDRRERHLAEALGAELPGPPGKTTSPGPWPDDGFEPDGPGDAFALVAKSLPIFIAELDEPYRRALELTDLEGLTQAEAARREGVSLTAMKSRVRRGRRQVYDALRRCCRFELDGRGRVLDFEPRAPVGCRAQTGPGDACACD